ncbi:Mss4-like protein [Paraphoma chrysanthemicola]|uniref:Mss4-like protein n=1 Tax=Paraphoma chrysanthemicola TaxID=798071 RepID=A0A8K0RBJ9_9PLEO|nr:Mss4-like protein [Paraphoma chrysanthemicola]
MTDTIRPESITGGCLCGAIRFTIVFPNETDWPPLTNGICQCTMCRKHSGSLHPQNCGFATSQVSPPIQSNPSYQTYASSPTTERGFCNNCGSALAFHDMKEPNVVEINLGALDEEVLVGKRDETNAWEDEHGTHVARIGGWGRILGTPRYHIYCENEIPGVTDTFAGDKWLKDKKDGSSFRGKAQELKKSGS